MSLSDLIRFAGAIRVLVWFAGTLFLWGRRWRRPGARGSPVAIGRNDEDCDASCRKSPRERTATWWRYGESFESGSQCKTTKCFFVWLFMLVLSHDNDSQMNWIGNLQYRWHSFESPPRDSLCARTLGKSFLHRCSAPSTLSLCRVRSTVLWKRAISGKVAFALFSLTV